MAPSMNTARGRLSARHRRHTASGQQPFTHVIVGTITSADALAAYLRKTPAGQSPLDFFSAGAKQRFLSSLRFGSKGLGGFSTDGLQAELTDDEIRQVLSLFDAQDYAARLHGVDADGVACRPPCRATAPGCPESRIEQRFNQFHELWESSMTGESGESRQARSRLFSRRYHEWFATEQQPDKLKILSDNDLKLL